MPTTPRPAPVADSDIADLRRRLEDTRLPQVPEESDWARGTDLSFLSAVIRSWRHEYDWRVHESRIQALPWESAGEGGRELRFVHQKSVVADVPVVVLLHGWPDSVLRFERVLPLLADLNVVVPALPGFPFAPQLTAAGMDTQKIAALIADTMDSLGYDRYVVSGGDIGGDVAEHLAAQRPSQVSALHLTNISPLHAVFADRSALSGDDLDYLDRVAAWQRAEGGYIAEQSSKPNTLAVGLADSPAGLAAWIVEKLRGWSDNDGDVESVFAREDLLTWISAYWHTGTIGTSFGTYADSAPPVPFVETPTVVSSFAHDTKPARRAFAERFVNVQHWLPHDLGGHFAAWEQPALYVRDLRQAVTLGERSAPHR